MVFVDGVVFTWIASIPVTFFTGGSNMTITAFLGAYQTSSELVAR